MEWQLAIWLEVEGVKYDLSFDETRAIVDWLRKPNPYVPEADPGSLAAAVFLERLLEDPTAENPPMNDEEARGILLALTRMTVREGLTARQERLHAALFAYLGRPHPPPSSG